MILSIIAFAVNSISLLKPKIQNLTNDSFLYPSMLKTGAFLINLTPEDFNTTKLGDKAADAASAEANKSIQKAMGR